MGTVDVHPIYKQHVKVNIEFQCTAETLDQGDRTSVSCFFRQARFLDQVRDDGTVNDTQYLTYDRRVDNDVTIGCRAGQTVCRG